MAKNKFLKTILGISIGALAITATVSLIQKLNKPGKQPSISIKGTYKVNFYRGDEKVFNSQEIKEGECATDPGAPVTSDTKVFKGWMTEDDKQFDFSTPITKDTNLFANFVYGVYFNANGATGTLPEAQEYKTTKKIVLPECNLTKTGETFKGWNDGTVTYQAGDNYVVNRTVTFTAMWSNSNYNDGFKITYLPGEHAIANSEERYGRTSALDNSIVLASSTMFKAQDGYVFDKWKNQATNETYEAGTTQYFTSDITLVATWVEATTESGVGAYTADYTAGIYFPNVTDGTYTNGEFSSGEDFNLTFEYVVSGKTITFSIAGTSYSCEIENNAIKTALVINYNGTSYNFGGTTN